MVAVYAVDRHGQHAGDEVQVVCRQVAAAQQQIDLTASGFNAGAVEARIDLVADRKDPDRPNEPPYYRANGGDIISISNFPYSMLEIPVDISKDDANLTFEAKTDRLPPLLSKVWVILEPQQGK